ncbi:spore coat protein [Paenibacillus sp. SI8]|uniref:spore coat protein n=1 Tax=unclassified Paenibacillus TaxID=185978 RepID=UPI0034661019
MYQQNQNQFNSNQHQVHLQDEDLANFVLSELKRTAREYTTAALEAANPQIRTTFQSLVQKTLQDQAIVFQEIQKLGGYEIPPAAQQQIQQELQKQTQTAAKLQTFVQQNLSSANNSAIYQQPNHSLSQPSYQQVQSQNQIAALQQVSFQPAQTVNATTFPNAVYNQGFTPSTYNTHNAHNQQHAYSSPQGQSFQEQSYGQSQGYAASDYGTSGISSGSTVNKYTSTALSASETSGLTGRSMNASVPSRGQTSGQSAYTQGESSYGSKYNEGSKYSF